MRISKKPHIRRQELLMAAEKLFEKQGYSNTSVEAIIRAAGIAKGTFYYYFKTKQDILTAITHEIIQKLVVYFEDIAARSDLTAIEKLQLLLVGSEKNAKIKPAMMTLLHKPENRELQEQLNVQTIERIAPIMAKVVTQGNAEKVFNVAAPLATVQLILAGSQFVLDSGLFDWSCAQRKKLLNALRIMAERALDASPNTLSFIEQG